MISEVKGTAECIQVWNNRLLSRDPKTIQLMAKAQASNCQKKQCDKLKTCNCGMKAKITRNTLTNNSESRAADILDLIHTDVCGPMRTVTPGGTKYYMTIIDDHSKYCKVYLLKRKSDVADKVKEYVKCVQTKLRKHQRESDLIEAESTPEKSYIIS